MYYNKRALKIRHSIQKKLKKFILSLLDIPFIIPGLLFLLLIRLIRPLVIIRIGIADVTKIGRIFPLDYYLSEKKNSGNKNKYVDLFYFDEVSNHVNQQWLIMWKRALANFPSTRLWLITKRLNKLIPGYQIHEILENYEFKNYVPTYEEWQKFHRDASFSIYGERNEKLKSVLSNKKPNISFNCEEELLGQKTLESFGIQKSQQYICFHCRDHAYLDEVNNNIDWNYHNFRDSSIQNYILMAEEMANRGYYSLRMGAICKESIHSMNSHVIDYANTNLRSDFNDIYLGSHCRFFLSTDTGITAIPESFRIPTVYVNWANILHITNTVLNGLFIFKKFFLKNENRFMCFSEIMNLKFGGKDTNEVFENLNIELIENTPNEILAVSIEMDERLNGTWESSKGDDELQECFWSLFGPEKLKSPDLRIGAEYLVQNKELLQ